MENKINKKVMMYIEESDIFDYGIIKDITEDSYLIKPLEDNRKEQYWLITNCEIID